MLANKALLRVPRLRLHTKQDPSAEEEISSSSLAETLTDVTYVVKRDIVQQRFNTSVMNYSMSLTSFLCSFQESSRD